MSDTIATTDDGRFRIVLEQDTDADPSDRQGAGYVYFVESGRRRDPVTVADEYDKAGAAAVGDMLTRALETFPGDLDTVARYFRTIGCAFDYFDDRDGRYVGITTPELAREWGNETPDVDLSEWQARADGDVYGYVIEELAHWTTNTIGGVREHDAWVTVDDIDGALWGMYGRGHAEEMAREAWGHFLDTVTVENLAEGVSV